MVVNRSEGKITTGRGPRAGGGWGGPLAYMECNVTLKLEKGISSCMQLQSQTVQYKVVVVAMAADICTCSSGLMKTLLYYDFPPLKIQSVY